MDQIEETTEQVQENTVSAPERKTRKPRKPVSLSQIPWQKIRRKLPWKPGTNVSWYWDIRLYALPLLVIMLLLALPEKQKPEEAAPVMQVAETVAEETAAEQIVPETTAPVEVRDAEAEVLARLADSVGTGRSDNVKRAIMWIAINRSEDTANGYGKSLTEEVERANQWQGYDENARYQEGTYRIALEVLDIKRGNKLRPLDNDMLWLVLNDNGSVTVRNQFKASGSSKWREKTIY